MKDHKLAVVGRYETVTKRGTAEHPCEDCGNVTTGNTLDEGWYRCNACGYPSK